VVICALDLAGLNNLASEAERGVRG
jgi:hypothetical protein